MFSKICLSVFMAAMIIAPCATGWADGAPTKDEVIARVQSAVQFYKANGRDKAIAELNKKDGLFATGENYVDLHDVSGICLAHPVSPGIVGLNRLDQADPSGKHFIQEIIDTAKTKPNGWITYLRKNPVSGKIEKKLAYWEAKDGLIFKAGTYE